MKIAYLLLQYPKKSETFINEEIKELRKRHKVDVFSIYSENEKTANFYAKRSFCPRTIKWASRLLLNSWRDIKYIPQALWISKHIKKYDHVHTWFSSSAATITYIAATEAKKPFSFSAHSRDIFVPRESESLRKKRIEKAKFVLVPSEWHKRYMTKKFGFNSKYHIIPNSIDVRKFRPRRAKKTDQVIFIGRDVEKKGFKYLKYALDLLPGYKLIHISGKLSESDLIRKLNESKVLAMPSIIASDGDSDGFPTAVMEAMACEIPIVTTNIRALPEMIDGCGLLVEQKNPEDLAKAIIKITKSRKLYKKFGKNGRKNAIERFDVVKNTNKLEKLMEGKF